MSGLPAGPSRAPLILLAALILTALVYWPGLRGGYLFDDYSSIVENPAVHVTSLDARDWIAAARASTSRELPRPLAMASFAANHYFTGLDPFPMKLTNLLLHLGNGALLYSVLLALARTARPDEPEASNAQLAVLVTAGWLLAPINLTGVLYVVQRMECLAQLFVLGGLRLYLLGRARQRAGRAGTAWIGAGLVGGTLLGALAKETAILLPAYALACEVTVLRFDGSSRVRRGLVAAYALLLAAPLMLGLAWLLPGIIRGHAFDLRPFTLAERLLTEGRVVVDYLRWTLLPDPRALGFYHDDIELSHGWSHPGTTLPALLFLGALLAGAFVARRTLPLVALGLLWFFVAHTLTATVLPLELVYEHRNYFASAGLLLALVAALIDPRFLPARIGLTVALVLIAWSATVTALRALDWSHPLRFALAESQHHPRSARAAYEYGRALLVASDYRADSPLLERSRAQLEAARRMPTSGILPEQALLFIAGHAGTSPDPDWWTGMQRKLSTRPATAEELAGLQALVRCQVEGPCAQMPEPLLQVFLAALEHTSRDPLLLVGYAQFAWYELQDPVLAGRVAADALERAHGSASVRAALAPILDATGPQP